MGINHFSARDSVGYVKGVGESRGGCPLEALLPKLSSNAAMNCNAIASVAQIVAQFSSPGIRGSYCGRPLQPLIRPTALIQPKIEQAETSIAALDSDSQAMRRPCISLLRASRVAHMVINANLCLSLLLLPFGMAVMLTTAVRAYRAITDKLSENVPSDGITKSASQRAE